MCWYYHISLCYRLLIIYAVWCSMAGPSSKEVYRCNWGNWNERTRGPRLPSTSVPNEDRETPKRGPKVEVSLKFSASVGYGSWRDVFRLLHVLGVVDVRFPMQKHIHILMTLWWMQLLVATWMKLGSLLMCVYSFLSFSIVSTVCELMLKSFRLVMTWINVIMRNGRPSLLLSKWNV